MKLERKKRGWSQEQLAKKLHMSRTTLGKYERGEIPMDLNLIATLSKLFEMSFLKCIDSDEKRIYRLKERRLILVLRKEKDIYEEILDYPERLLEILKKYY